VNGQLVDEDVLPVAQGDIRESDAGTADESVVFRMPLRVQFNRGKRRWLVVRAYTRTAEVTLAEE
jgi:hypothetical protein